MSLESPSALHASDLPTITATCPRMEGAEPEGSDSDEPENENDAAVVTW